MDNLQHESLYNLATRMNQIELEIQRLEIEYNGIVNELQRRIPNLKEDSNVQPKVLRKVREEK